MTWRVVGSPERVCEWITITAEQDIHDSATPNSQEWLELLHACRARKKCEGYEGAYWSRILEEREKIWIWTFWTTKKAYEQHKETEAYKSFHEYLISISTTSPTTQVLELARDGSYSKRCLLTGGWPTITMTYFDEPLSDSQHTCIRRIRGMVPYCISRYPPKFGETRGFLQSNMDNVAPSSGAPAIVYVFVDWWASPDREEHVRNSRTYTPEYPGEAISLSTMMERQLKEAGCVGNDVRHVRFNWVVEYSDLNKTLAGRSLEFVPNRKSFLSDLHSHIR